MCARMCTRDAHDAFAREPSESDSSGDRQPVAYCGKTALTLWPYALCFNGECRQETQARYSLHRSRCFLLPAKKARLAAISTQQPEAPASLTQTSETLRKLCHTRCRSVAVFQSACSLPRVESNAADWTLRGNRSLALSPKCKQASICSSSVSSSSCSTPRPASICARQDTDVDKAVCAFSLLASENDHHLASKVFLIY